jgi:hypothetical protein
MMDKAVQRNNYMQEQQLMQLSVYGCQVAKGKICMPASLARAAVNCCVVTFHFTTAVNGPSTIHNTGSLCQAGCLSRPQLLQSRNRHDAMMSWIQACKVANQATLQ